MAMQRIFTKMTKCSETENIVGEGSSKVTYFARNLV